MILAGIRSGATKSTDTMMGEVVRKDSNKHASAPTSSKIHSHISLQFPGYILSFSLFSDNRQSCKYHGFLCIFDELILYLTRYLNLTNTAHTKIYSTCGFDCSPAELTLQDTVAVFPARLKQFHKA